MGKWNVPIITLLASLNFRVASLLTIARLICCKRKKNTHKKENNQNSMVEKYFFGYKKEIV